MVHLLKKCNRSPHRYSSQVNTRNYQLFEPIFLNLNVTKWHCDHGPPTISTIKASLRHSNDDGIIH